MHIYKYVAYSEANRKIKGIVKAKDKNELIKILKERKLILLKSEVIADLDNGIFKKMKKIFRKKLSQKEIINFTHEMSIMQESGISFLKALNLQLKEMKNKRFKQIIIHIIKSLKNGMDIGNALEKYKEDFGVIYYNMIIVGERTGRLPMVMKILVKLMKKREDARKKIKSAMLYPNIVFATTLAVALLLIMFVLPKFMEIFSGNSNLPQLTVILLQINYILRNYHIELLISLCIIFLSVKILLKNKNMKKLFYRVLVKIPAIGPIYKKFIAINFLRSFGMFIESGTPLLYSLEILEKMESDYFFKNELYKLKEKIKSGERIGATLKKSKFISPTSIAMINVGEESGNLVYMLEKAAEYNEMEFNEKTDYFLTLIEPMMIIFLGMIVGIIILGIYLPMFEMMNSIN